MIRRGKLGGSVLLLVASSAPIAVAACSGHEAPVPTPPPDESLGQLAEKYPAAAELLRPTGPSPSANGDSFELRSKASDAPERNGRWASSARAVRIAVGSDGTRMVSSHQGAFEVVRVGSKWSGLRAEGGAVVARDASSRVETALVPREDGVEELVQLAPGETELEYRFDLPAGWKLRASRGRDATVEVLDERSAARFRVRSDDAWDEAGNDIDLVASVDGPNLKIALAEPAVGSVLVDPLWQQSGEVEFVRRGGSSTLLSSGRILLAGGVDAIGGEADPRCELFDPRTLTYQSGGVLQQARIDHVTVLLANGKVLFAGGFASELGDIAVSQDGKSVPLPALQSAELYDPVSGTSTLIGDMTTPRARASATVLLDGRVLIAGGTSDGATHATAEVYDPEAETFEQITMPGARQEQVATLLPNGRVLLSGGTNGVDTLATTVVYDPASGFSAGPSLNAARFGHLAVPLADGRLFVAGGKQSFAADTVADEHDDVLDGAETLDVGVSPLPAFVPVDGAGCAEGTFGQLSEGRFLSAAALMANGKVLIAGGRASAEGSPIEFPIKEVDLFDPSTNCFEPIEGSIYLTAGPALTALPSGKLALTGRSPSAQLIDSAKLGTSELTLVPDVITPRLLPTTTLLANGKVLIVGGEDYATGTYYADAYIYDPQTGEATQTPGSLTEGRSGHVAIRLFDGKVLIAGGGGFSDGFSSAELFDPDTGLFEVVGSMSARRVSASATLLPSAKVLVAGGLETLNTATSTADIYDPDTKSFMPAGTMNTPRGQHSATLLTTGDVLITGGTPGFFGAPIADAEVFDAVEEEFVLLPNMKEARKTHNSVPLPDGRVLLADGSPSGSSETFDPTSQTFTFVGPTPLTRFRASAVIMPSGNVALLGGESGGGAQLDSNEVFVFDPLTDSWSVPFDTSDPTQTLKLEEARIWSSATLLPDGSALVVGGFTYNGASLVSRSSVERFSESLAPGIAAAKPQLTSAPSVAEPGTVQSIAGTSLSGFGEIGSGTFGSNSRFPVALWLPIGGAFEVGTFTEWTDETAQWLAPAPRYPGPGLLFSVAGGVRSNGLSVALPPADLGIACSTDSQCQSGFCRDGVCCDTACEGGCSACAASLKGQGEDGVCEPVVVDEDPRDFCPEVSVCPETTGACDGAGECKTCPPPTQCDGDHTLIGADDVSQDCSPFRCSEESNQCLTACESVSDCIAGLVCDAGGSCVPPALDDNSDGGCAFADGRGTTRRELPIALALGLMGLALRRRGARRVG